MRLRLDGTGRWRLAHEMGSVEELVSSWEILLLLVPVLS